MSQFEEKMISDASQAGIQLSTAMIALLKAMSRQSKDTFKDEDDKGYQKLQWHIKHGGKVKQSIIDPEDQVAFETALRVYHVPYIKLEIKDTDGNPKEVYITRAGANPEVPKNQRALLIDDSRQINDAWKMFSVNIQAGMSEISAQDFIAAANNKNISQTQGLTKEEVEIFRKTMAGRNGSYTFTVNKDNPKKFDLLYLEKDKEQIGIALKDMAFELSGITGHAFREQLIEDMAAEKKFKENAIPTGKETMYIVDADKPNEFISVTKDGFRTHSIQIAKEKTKEGQKEVYLDVDGKGYRKHNKLLDFTRELKKPIVMTAEEFKLVQGFGSDGKAILPEQSQIKGIYEQTKESLKDRSFYHGIRARQIEDIGKVYTLTNIDSDRMSKVHEAIDKAGLQTKAVIVGQSIAFPEDIKDQMDRIFDETLYKRLTPFEKIEDRTYFEGRGNISFANIKEEKDSVYIVDTANGHKNYTFKVSPKGLDIINDGEKIAHFDKGTKDYEDKLSTIFESMKDPVILSKEEMEGDKDTRNEALETRMQINQKSEAKNYVSNLENNKREEIHDVVDETDERCKKLDDRQKEAIHYVLNLKTIDTYVDRTFQEKILDFDLSSKLVQETHTTTTKEVER